MSIQKGVVAIAAILIGVTIGVLVSWAVGLTDGARIQVLEGYAWVNEAGTAIGLSPDGEAPGASYVVAGEAMLTHFHGMAYHAHYILGSASLLISSILMLRSSTFSRATAYVGIVTNIIVFGLYVPEIGVWISMLSVLGYLIWYILIARKLIRLGWGGSQMEGS